MCLSHLNYDRKENFLSAKATGDELKYMDRALRPSSLDNSWARKTQGKPARLH